MIAGPLTDRARLAVLNLEQAGRAAIGQIKDSRLLRWRLGGPSADHLLLVPQDLRTADPSFALEIYNGHFGLSGTFATTDNQSPFEVEPPTMAWERELHSFGWLRHLRAARNDISREQARALVADWMTIGQSNRRVLKTVQTAAHQPNIHQQNARNVGINRCQRAIGVLHSTSLITRVLEGSREQLQNVWLVVNN